MVRLIYGHLSGRGGDANHGWLRPTKVGRSSYQFAEVAELVDALDSGSSVARHAGSNPALGNESFRLWQANPLLGIVNLKLARVVKLPACRQAGYTLVISNYF